MNRKQQLAFNRHRRMSGWNDTVEFDGDGYTSRTTELPDGSAFLKKAKYPDGKIIRDGLLKVTQPCAVESDSHRRSWVFDALIGQLSCPSAWRHLNLGNIVLDVESVVPRRIGKRQYEVDATLRVRVTPSQAVQAPKACVAVPT